HPKCLTQRNLSVRSGVVLVHIPISEDTAGNVIAYSHDVRYILFRPASFIPVNRRWVSIAYQTPPVRWSVNDWKIDGALIYWSRDIPNSFTRRIPHECCISTSRHQQVRRSSSRCRIRLPPFVQRRGRRIVGVKRRTCRLYSSTCTCFGKS